MKFVVSKHRPAVSDAEREKFASAAISREDDHDSGKRKLKPIEPAKKPTESILFRCSKADFDKIDRVYQNLNFKSRQSLLESILLPRIREIEAMLDREN
jgi:hypothetical protein